MIKYILIFFVLLLLCPGGAFPEPVGDMTSGPKAIIDFSGAVELMIPGGAFVDMPASPGPGSIYQLTNANSTTDCSGGGGTATAFCQFDGTLWISADAPTNIAVTPAAADVAVSSSTGSNTTIPAADTTNAGVMTAADKIKLDSIDPSAVADHNNLTGRSAADQHPPAAITGLAAALVDVGLNSTDRHAHSNKTILDNSTASFTTAEETKLTGIETAATADQTAAEVPFTPDTDTVATDVQGAIMEVRNDAAEVRNHLVTLTGVVVDGTHLGGFSGTTITDDRNITQALQELETAVEVRTTSSTSMNIYTSDDCGLISGMAAGDLCFEY